MLKHSKEVERIDYYLINLDDVNAAEQDYNQALQIESGDAKLSCACIKCAKPQCISYYDEEYLCDSVIGFASDLNSSACPTNAINWSNEEQEIVINQSACIKCGICISRCPFGAIYFDNMDSVAINTDRSNYRYEIVTLPEEAEELQEECAKTIENLTTSRKHRRANEQAILDIYSAIKNNPAVAALLCRNLFISFGANCALRRIGDIYARMDAVFELHGSVGVIEMEFESDTLSVIRNLLDDLAIMQSRYGISVRDLIPVALCLSLPNTRQGFYQVCDDVDTVLDIQIRTLTIGALLLLLWNGADLVFADDNFRLGFRDTSIKRNLELLAGHQLVDDDLGLGLYQPTK